MGTDKIKNLFGKREIRWAKIIILAIISAAAIAISSGMSLRTQYPSLIALLCLIVFWAEGKLELSGKQKKFGNVLGFIYAGFVVVGSYDVWTNYGFMIPGQNIVNFMIVAVGTVSLSVSGVKVIVGMLDRWENKSKETEEKYSKFFIPVCFVIIFLCWFPYFLTYYPGVLSTDSIVQLAQVMGVEPYSNHHPMIHTLFLKCIYDMAFTVCKNTNASVAACVIVQMLIMDGIYTYMLSVMKKANIKKKYLYLCLGFIALCPVNAYFSITIWKDILFGGFALLFAITFWQITQLDFAHCKKSETAGLLLRFLIVGMLFCLWRSNGFYAYLFCIPFFMLSKSLKKIKLWLAIAMFITVGAVFVIKGPVMEHYEVTQPDFVEHINIPIQHVARVVVEKGCENLPAEDILWLNQIADVEQFEEHYYPHISDGMKAYIRSGNADYLDEHKKEFFGLWLRWGVKYPGSYIRAQIDMTRGFWFPNYEYWVTWEGIEPNALGIYRDSLVPDAVGLFMTAVQNFFKNMPFFELLWKIGFFVWAELFCIAYTVRRRKSILIYLPTIAIFLTLMIATPVAGEFRYGYAFVTCLPFFMGITFPQLQNK